VEKKKKGVGSRLLHVIEHVGNASVQASPPRCHRGRGRKHGQIRTWCVL